MNVITGETGAGKTMVVTGLGLLFGGRADAGRVRADPGRAVVEGRLRLAEPVLDDRPHARRRRGRRARRRRHPAAQPHGHRRGPVPRPRRWPRHAGLDARRGGRAGRRRARPVRPAAPAAPGRAARRARPVRRRRPREAARRAARGVRPVARGSPTTWPTGGATRASATRRPTCCGWASTRSPGSTRSRGKTTTSRPRRSGSSTPRGCARPLRWPTRRSPAPATVPTRRRPPRACWAPPSGRWRASPASTGPWATWRSGSTRRPP